MLLRSSSLGARRHLVEADAGDAGAVGVLLEHPLAADVDARPRATAAPAPARRLQRVLHVVDPDRQREAAAGFARRRACAAGRSRSTPPRPGSAASRRTTRRANRWWCRSCRRCRAASACACAFAAVPERVTSCSRLVITNALRASSMRCDSSGAVGRTSCSTRPLVSVTLADQHRLDAVAAVGEHAVGPGHLQRRHRRRRPAPSSGRRGACPARSRSGCTHCCA